MNSFFSNFRYFSLSSLHSFSIFSFTCPFVDECRGGMNDFCAHLQLKIFVLHFSPRLFFLIWCNVAEVLLFRCPAFPEVRSKLHCQWPKPFEFNWKIRSFMFRTKGWLHLFTIWFHVYFHHLNIIAPTKIIASNIIAQNIIAPPKISLLKISLLKYHCSKYHCSKYHCFQYHC